MKFIFARNADLATANGTRRQDLTSLSFGGGVYDFPCSGRRAMTLNPAAKLHVAAAVGSGVVTQTNCFLMSQD